MEGKFLLTYKVVERITANIKCFLYINHCAKYFIYTKSFNQITN